MTIMRVSLVGSTLSDQQKETLANRLIDNFARPMVEASPSGKAAVVFAHVMAGSWTKDMKSELAAVRGAEDG